MANAIAKAILNYKNELEKRVVNQQPFDVKENSKKTTKVTANETNDIRFRVQLAASKNPIDAKPYNFKGLKNVIRDKEGTFINIILVIQITINKSKKNREKPAEQVSNLPLLSLFKGNQKIKLSEALDALK